MNETADGVVCITWDEYDQFDYVTAYPNAGLEDNNFCRNPTDSDARPYCNTEVGEFGNDWGDCDIPACDSCKCMPPCGQPINETCPCQNVLQSQECCEENDSGCKCEYLKDAVV